MRVKERTAEEIARLGQQLYDTRLKALLEPDHNDEFVVINVENGDYFLDTSDLDALRAARTEYPAQVLFLARVGAETAYRTSSSGGLLVLAGADGLVE